MGFVANLALTWATHKLHFQKAEMGVPTEPLSADLQTEASTFCIVIDCVEAQEMR